MSDWKSSLRSDPIPWLLENGCASIRHRTLVELLDLPKDHPEVQKSRQDIQAYGPALKLEKSQKKDGSWGGAIHASDPKKFQNCTENAMLQLFEHGWNREQKAIRQGAKVLRQYLTQKKDVPMYEFAKLVKADERRETYYRWMLRTVALGLLIRAGYEEEKNRAAVLELLDSCAGFVDNPISRDPTEEIGATLPLIRFEAWKDDYVFFPDIYALRVFAWSPWLLRGEMAKMRLKKIFDYVLSDTYQALAPDLGLIRTAKGTFARGGGIDIHPTEYYQKHGNLDELLMWLELLARLGLVNRYPLLIGHLEWLQGQQGKDGRWNLSTKLWSDASRWSQLLRLERDWRSPVRKEADLTFRVLVILKHQWERQMRMLDRRDDGYPF
jgi:hypothetical protein